MQHANPAARPRQDHPWRTPCWHSLSTNLSSSASPLLLRHRRRVSQQQFWSKRGGRGRRGGLWTHDFRVRTPPRIQVRSSRRRELELVRRRGASVCAAGEIRGWAWGASGNGCGRTA
jgi:hypothetical protein